MKPNVHPNYEKVVFMDVNSGYKFLTGSTKKSNEVTVWEDGNTYPLIKVEISSDTHPFYTGKQKFADRGGRVDRFLERYNMKERK